MNCTFDQAKFYVVTGRSGSGKTTLLSLLAGLDRPVEGEIFYEGKSYAELNMARLRREKISIIFQNFQLFPLLTVEENIMYPMEISGKKIVNAKQSAGLLLKEVGLAEGILKKFPVMLSGGEQQRVAIARALASEAKVILADEPTGNLDFENGKNVIRILKNLVIQENYCVILVTHDREIAKQADIIYEVQDGRIHYLDGGNK